MLLANRSNPQFWGFRKLGNYYDSIVLEVTLTGIRGTVFSVDVFLVSFGKVATGIVRERTVGGVEKCSTTV